MVSTQAYVRMIFTVLKTCDTRAQKIAALEAALLVTRADEQVEAERAGWQVFPTQEAARRFSEERLMQKSLARWIQENVVNVRDGGSQDEAGTRG